MDNRIREAFTEVWRLYQENYELHPQDSHRWDKLLRSAEEIYERYKEYTVVMNVLLVILEDIDTRSIIGD